MPLFLAALIGGLVSAAGTIVGRVLISLGIGYVIFTGVDTSLDWMRDQAIASIGDLPAVAVGIAGVLQIGTAISMVASAYAVRLLLAGLTSGTMVRMVQR